MTPVRSFVCTTLTALVALSFSPGAHAYDEDNWFNKPFRVYIGAFHAQVDSKLSINSPDVPELVAEIDIEDVLGVDDSDTTFWGGASWQFFKRHGVEFEFFSLNRNASISDTFDPPIEIGDLAIESGAVGSEYNTSVSRLTYAFSAIRTDRSNLALKVGFHVADLEAGVFANGNICTPETTPSAPPGCPLLESEEARESVTAPLPHFGISWAYALSPNWAISASALGFAIELDDIDGSIIELDADVAWQPWENFGLGLGVRYFKTEVDSQGSDLNGKFEFEYVGPALFVQAMF